MFLMPKKNSTRRCSESNLLDNESTIPISHNIITSNMRIRLQFVLQSRAIICQRMIQILDRQKISNQFQMQRFPSYHSISSASSGLSASYDDSPSRTTTQHCDRRKTDPSVSFRNRSHSARVSQTYGQTQCCQRKFIEIQNCALK